MVGQGTMRNVDEEGQAREIIKENREK